MKSMRDLCRAITMSMIRGDVDGGDKRYELWRLIPSMSDDADAIDDWRAAGRLISY